MHAFPSLEKAESYLQIHLSRSGPIGAPTAKAPFVTLSRQAGAGASSVARILAAILNAQRDEDDVPWTVFDGNLVEAMLDANHFSSTLARYLPEDAVREFPSAVGELVGLHPSLWDLNQRTHDLVRKLARLGHCILLGRGGNFTTQDLPNGVHVRLVGSPVQRARHMADVLGVTEEAAASRNLKADIARSRYVRQSFNREVSDPAAYDLVINTDQVGYAEAAQMIAAVVRARQPAPLE